MSICAFNVKKLYTDVRELSYRKIEKFSLKLPNPSPLIGAGNDKCYPPELPINTRSELCTFMGAIVTEISNLL